MDSKMISVVVTCYNHESYIADCLESIFLQTYRNIELLVFDDGSTDDSLSIINSALVASPFEKTKCYSDENCGVVITRNKALDILTGDYFLFIDSDDAIPEDYIEKLVNQAETTNADIVYSSLVDFYTGQTVLEAKEFSLEELFVGNFINASSLVRTKAIGEVRFDEELNRKRLEDYDFFLNLIANHQLVARPCQEAFLKYRLHQDSRSNHENYKAYYSTYRYILCKYLVTFPEKVNNSLEFHFNRLTSLDIEHSIKEQYLEVYSLGENEELIHRRPILFSDSFELSLTNSYSKLRVKPSNIPSFYQNFYVEVGGKKLNPILSNGIITDHSSIVFKDFSPFIDFEIPTAEDISVKISYKRYNINDIVASDYIGKILAQEKSDSQMETRRLLDEMKVSQDKYDNLQQEYLKTINSKRWTIPTKIINFFRRKK